MNPSTARGVLLVDDEALFVRAACKLLNRAGLACTGCHSLAEARDLLRDQTPGLIILDVRLPDGSGLELLGELRAAGRELPPVIVLTAFGDIDDAVLAMKLGATDYLQKPCDIQVIIDLARQLLQGAPHQPRPAADRPAAPDTDELIGDSQAMRDLRIQLDRIATLSRRTALPPPTVLLTGETGVGKGLVACRLHAHSARRAGPFVQVDCAALPRELIESELFGHMKGAFTSAHRDKSGLIEQAAGGTLFLDEIGELPPDLQAKLLAVVDRRRARRVGGTEEYATDAWFITATHCDLSQMSAEGRFRSDLYYRLSPLTIQIPALREHPQDIAPLARHYLDRLLDRYGLDARFTAEAEDCLAAHAWPGNVRELIGVVERALFTSQGGAITPSHLELESRAPAVAAPDSAPALREAEREMIRRTLRETDGNVSAAARRLGMTRMMLRYRIQKFGLSTHPAADD